MSSCKEKMHSCGTACCAKYVCITGYCHCCFSCVLLTMLVGFFGMQAYFANSIEEPIFSGGVLLSFGWLKGGLLVAGLLLIAQCYIGRKFGTEKKRLQGVALLVLLVGVLGVQVWAFGHVYASEVNLERIESWLGNGNGSAINLDPDWTNSSRKSTYVSWWNHFEEAYTSFGCNTTKGDGTTPGMLLSEMLDDTEATDDHEEAEALFRRLQGVDDIGCCDQAKTECTRNSFFADALTADCAPNCNPEGDEKTTAPVCNGCKDTFLKDWIGLTEEEIEETDPVLRVQFCRCMPNTLFYLERIGSWTIYVMIGYVMLEVMLVLSTVWLIMCGPDGQTEGEEIELGPDGLDDPAFDDPGDGSQLVQVVCPFDSGPGQEIMVRFGGKEMKVVVPEHVMPGTAFYTRV